MSSCCTFDILREGHEKVEHMRQVCFASMRNIINATCRVHILLKDVPQLPCEQIEQYLSDLKSSKVFKIQAWRRISDELGERFEVDVPFPAKYSGPIQTGTLMAVRYLFERGSGGEDVYDSYSRVVPAYFDIRKQLPMLDIMEAILLAQYSIRNGFNSNHTLVGDNSPEVCYSIFDEDEMVDRIAKGIGVPYRDVSGPYTGKELTFNRTEAKNLAVAGDWYKLYKALEGKKEKID